MRSGRLSGVLSMTSMTGVLDVGLRVARKDQSDLVRLIETLRSKAGVQETNTSIILGEVTRWA
jgi:Lrp/AsnC family transcriptional regulator, leucine-responsive regulatory protein